MTVEKQARKFLVTLVVFMVVSFLVGGYIGKSRGVPFVKSIGEYSIGIYTGQSPFVLFPSNNVTNPVLTFRDVTDVSAEFVADPFMINDDGKWYMFFEVLNKQSHHGDIGLAVSDDGLTWTYKQIVLDESFHLSYPNVFKLDSEYYMIPETREAYSVRLYKSNDFPYKWSYVANLVEGNYVDPSVFHYDGLWWMFVSERNDVLHLFYSSDLKGEWKSHPASPLVKLDGNIARPAGRVLFYDNKIFRYTQDCDPAYGSEVCAFEIVKLTAEDYQEKAVSYNPILKGSNQGWNAQKMHHIDPHNVEGVGWLACVDGYGKSYVFGIRY